MSVWNVIQNDALASVLAQVQAITGQREELSRIIADATADRLAGMPPSEQAKRKKRAKEAKQTLHNYRGSDASLAQEEKARSKALNKLLFDNKGKLGAMANVMVEALILSTQIDEIRKARAEAEAEAKPRVKAQERAWLDAYYAAGGSLWHLRQLSKSDHAFLAAFAREKAQDPHHRAQDGLAMAAYRAGHLELCVEGLNEHEQTALLLAAGRITEADIDAKKAFETAAGRPLPITPTLAGALARAAEIRRAEGYWVGAAQTGDHAENAAFERDLQTPAEAMGSGEAVEARAWDVLRFVLGHRLVTSDPGEALEHEERLTSVWLPAILLEHVAVQVLDLFAKADRAAFGEQSILGTMTRNQGCRVSGRDGRDLAVLSRVGLARRDHHSSNAKLEHHDQRRVGGQPTRSASEPRSGRERFPPLPRHGWRR